MSKYKKVVIGIDQSYKRTGIGIAVDGTLVKVKSITYRGCTVNSDKRKVMSNIVHHILNANAHRASEIFIICERIRTFSGGFISTDYIKSTGALIATIVDAAYEYGVPVFSADTRSWKSQVLGTSKGGKGPAVKFVESKGFCLTSVNKKGKQLIDDDAADAGCIALYGFCNNRKLKLEV